MTLRLVSALMAAVAVQACAQAGSDAATAPLAKSTWTVSKAWCPVGCSAATAGVLKAQVGQPVQLSATQLGAGFIDPCEGQVRLNLKSTPVAEIVADVNKGAAPGRKPLVAADLGVTGAALSGWALCHGAGGDTNLQRLLVVLPDRVVMLSEEQSLIELR